MYVIFLPTCDSLIGNYSCVFEDQNGWEGRGEIWYT